MEPSITAEQVSFLARHNGLALSDAQVAELVEVYPLVARMSALIHQPRGLADEPSNIFVPGAAS